MLRTTQRFIAEVKWVLEELASGRYELRSNSDGGEPYLYRVCDGLCLGIPDVVMQYMIAEELIEFMPQP
jgi:hypothetical protein